MNQEPQNSVSTKLAYFFSSEVLGFTTCSRDCLNVALTKVGKYCLIQAHPKCWVIRSSSIYIESTAGTLDCPGVIQTNKWSWTFPYLGNITYNLLTEKLLSNHLQFGTTLGASYTVVPRSQALLSDKVSPFHKQLFSTKQSDSVSFQRLSWNTVF